MERKSSSVHVSNDEGYPTMKQLKIENTGGHPPMKKRKIESIEGHSTMKQPKTENTEVPEIDDGEYWPLSGKSYVDMILTKTCVKPPYNLYLPKKMYKLLPSAGAPVVLTCGRKKWDMFYGGDKSHHKFNSAEWKKFVHDKNLKEGDGLVFELSECSATKIELKVQVLTGEFPPELIPKEENKEGASSDKPILLD